MNTLLLIPAWFYLLISASFCVAGDYLSKRWAMHPSLGMTIIIIIVYALASLIWLPFLLHRNQIAIMATMWLVTTMIGAVAIGIIIFGEKLTVLQWLALGLALISMIILATP